MAEMHTISDFKIQITHTHTTIIVYVHVCVNLKFDSANTYDNKIAGLVRDLNPGPLAPKARIIPLDQRATHEWNQLYFVFMFRKVDSPLCTSV